MKRWVSKCESNIVDQLYTNQRLGNVISIYIKIYIKVLPTSAHLVISVLNIISVILSPRKQSLFCQILNLGHASYHLLLYHICMDYNFLVVQVMWMLAGMCTTYATNNSNNNEQTGLKNQMFH